MKPRDALTLPWNADVDGDLADDGLDPCPLDPFNACSISPLEPVVTASADLVVSEPQSGQGFAIVVFRIDRLYDKPVSISYDTVVLAGDGASEGSDYIRVSGVAVIEPGKRTAQVEVPVLADNLTETAERFRVVINSVDNGVVGDDGSVVVALSDPGNPALPLVVLTQSAQSASSGDVIQFDASASSNPGGGALDYFWRQTDASGITVSLSDITAPVVQMTAPQVSDTVFLEFTLQLTNEAGLSSTSQLSLRVDPVNNPPFVTAQPVFQLNAGASVNILKADLLAFVTDPEGQALSITGIVQQPAFGVLSDNGDSYNYSTAGGIPLVLIDQDNSGSTGGGGGSPAVQTFRAGRDNIAGLDFYLGGTGALEADVTLNIWKASAIRSGQPLLSQTLLAQPAQSLVQFRFPAVPLETDGQYAMEIILSTGLIVSTIAGNPYPDGAPLEFGGSAYTGNSDVYFVTYYDPSYNSTLGNTRVTQLSDSLIEDWQEKARSGSIIIDESGATDELPGNNRVVEADYAGLGRKLVAEVDSTEIFNHPDSNISYFTTADRLYRYLPGGTPELQSRALAELPPLSYPGDMVIDPRNGYLHICSKYPADTAYSWYLLVDDMSLVKQNVPCDPPDFNMLTGISVGSRFCIDQDHKRLFCTAQNEVVPSQYLDYAELGAYDANEILMIHQMQNSALLVLSALDAPGGNPINVNIHHLGDRADLDDNGVAVAQRYPQIMLLENVQVYLEPEMQTMPDGGVYALIADDDSFSVELYHWDGNMLNGMKPVVNTRFDSDYIGDVLHAGKLKLIDNRLFWLKQNFALGNTRELFLIDTTPGASSPLQAVASFSGQAGDIAPYDIVAAGNASVGYLEVNGDAGNTCLITLLDRNFTASTVENNADCNRLQSDNDNGLLFEKVVPFKGLNLHHLLVTPDATARTGFQLEVSDPAGNTTVLPVQLEVSP